MNVGAMRHRITFQAQEGQKDVLGGHTGPWKDVASVWAQVKPISGREYFSNVRETTVSHKIFCRYREGITPRLRVKYGKRVFKIISVINWDERNEGLTLMCEEMVP